jgi:hypothetical protein
VKDAPSGVCDQAIVVSAGRAGHEHLPRRDQHTYDVDGSVRDLPVNAIVAC